MHLSHSSIHVIFLYESVTFKYTCHIRVCICHIQVYTSYSCMHLSHTSVHVIFLYASVTFKYTCHIRVCICQIQVYMSYSCMHLSHTSIHVIFVYASVTFKYTFNYVGICCIPKRFTYHNFLILFYSFTRICLLIDEECKGVLRHVTSSIASKYPA